MPVREKKRRRLDLWELAPVVRLRKALAGTKLGRLFIYTHNAFELLLERRLMLFLIVDGFLVVMGLFIALETGGQVRAIYRSMVAYPTMLFGVPILAGTVALERRAGSLDLALAVPSTEAYFLRRVLPVCGFFVVQGWVLPHFVLILSNSWRGVVSSSVQLTALLMLHLHTVVLALLVGAVSLYWGSRLKSAGGVMVASGISLAILSRWIMNPLEAGPIGMAHRWLGVPVHVLANTWSLTVLGAATVIFYLYARERLRRPETMLA